MIICKILKLKIYFTYIIIAVIICKSSKFGSFFLLERYKKINEYQIYTCVEDTNTSKNKSANYNDIEKLWRFHFERKNK